MPTGAPQGRGRGIPHARAASFQYPQTRTRAGIELLARLTAARRAPARSAAAQPRIIVLFCVYSQQYSVYTALYISAGKRPNEKRPRARAFGVSGSSFARASCPLLSLGIASPI